MWRVKTLEEFIESRVMNTLRINEPRNWNNGMDKYFGFVLDQKDSDSIERGGLVGFTTGVIHPYHCIKVDQEINYEIY